jgi:hypothetical protein
MAARRGSRSRHRTARATTTPRSRVERRVAGSRGAGLLR